MSYNQDEIVRVSLDETADKILERKDVFLEDKHHNNHKATKRLVRR